jgi:CRISPR type III-B/RAMP module-associated protein Cmr3
MKYIINLKPTAPYFFGGEVTFGEIGVAESKQNYLVKSNLLPQASTLWGLVRYEILRQKNYLNYTHEQKEEVKKLIGNTGFHLNRKIGVSYGVIQGISPIFLKNADKYYTAMPLDEDMPCKKCECKEEGCECKGYQLKVNTDNPGKSYYSGKIRDKLVNIEGYDIKNYRNYRFWINNERNIIEAPFSICEQIGITKNSTENSNKEGFFKQKLVALDDDFCFTFILEVSDDAKLENVISNPVYLGGNRSMFMMSLTLIDDKNKDLEPLFSNLKKKNRKLLLSDAYITKDNFDKFDFVWGNAIPFRHIITSVDNGHSWTTPKKTEVLYYLLSKGSVIYSSDEVLNLNENTNNKSCEYKFGLNHTI